jgi:hypothetical protein
MSASKSTDAHCLERSQFVMTFFVQGAHDGEMTDWIYRVTRE